MGIDIIDLLSRDAAIFQGHLHAESRAFSFRIRGRDMMGIVAHPIACDLGVDPCLPIECPFQLLKNHHTGTFCRNESIPILVKGAAGLLRTIISLGRGLHYVEAPNRKGSQRSLCPTGYHIICIFPLDDLEGVSDGMAASCTGRNCAGIWPLKSISNGDETRSHIGDHHGYEKG